MSIDIVPVREPSDQDFVRVHPDEAYRLESDKESHSRDLITLRPQTSKDEPGRRSAAKRMTEERA
jgi:hypothetical protein